MDLPMLFRGRNRVICQLAAILLLLAPLAHAELATNISIDLRALSLGNAVTADPPGVSAVHYNPAGLALLDGRHIDYQFMSVSFGVAAQYSAPPGYNVFGYSDDPVVCQEPNGPVDYCKNFVTGESKVQGVSLYIPVLDKMVDLPPGPAIAPLMSFSVQAPGSKLTFANAMYAPMAAGLYRNDNDPGNFLGHRVAMERITLFSPSVGYQVNDAWSVGASFGLSYQAIAMDTGFRSPNELLGLMRLINESICPPFRGNGNFVTDLFLFGFCNAKKGIGPFDNLATLNLSMQQTASPTYNVGVLWKPTDRFSWGAVYQSEARMHLSGKYQITYAEGTQDVFNAVGGSPTGSLMLSVLGLPTYVPAKETGLVSMNLTYPAHFQTGISWRVFSPLKVNFDLGWTDYAKWDAFNLQFDRTPSVLRLARLLAPGTTLTSMSLPLGYQSPWTWGVGTEWSLSSRLLLRLGYEQRNSAIPLDKRSSLVPINNAHMYGLGFGYKYDKDTDVDFTVMHMESRDTIPANTSTDLNATGLNHIVYNPYAGLDVKTQATINLVGVAYRTRW